MRVFIGGIAGMLLGLTFAATAANAAKPEYLFTFPDTFTASTAGVTRLAIPGANTVECLSASSGTGAIKNFKEEIVDELFLGCETRVAGILVKCTGLPDKVTGSILATGKSTLGYELGTTNPLIVLEPGEVHFECTSAALVNVKGCFAGKLRPRNVPTTELSYEGPGIAIEDYVNETGKIVRCELLASVNSSTFKLATLQVTTQLTWASPVEVMA